MDELATVDASAAGNPRWIAKVDDTFWEIIHAEVELSGMNMTGSFRITCNYTDVGQANDLGTISPDSKLGKLMALQAPTRHKISIRAGYPADLNNPDADLIEIFSGVLDRVVGDVTEDSLILEGRDRSAILKETNVYAEFRNKSVKQVIEEIADKAGLDTNTVDSKSNAGTAYGDERSDFESVPTQGISGWDIICAFAEHDLYVAYVVGNTLVYKPVEDLQNNMVFSLGKNVEHLKWERNYSNAFSRIGVEIASSQLKSKDAVIASAGTKRTAGEFGGDQAIVRKIIPNIDQDSAGYIAESLALFYAQFEYIVTVNATGAETQSLFSGLKLDGTGTVFDRIFRPIRISWTYGFDSGWQVDMTAISLPPDAQTKFHRKRAPRNLTRIK